MIPIQNLYYLLCYAWDVLEERDLVAVSQAEVKSLADLFAKILEVSTAQLIKRGLDRQYVEEDIDSRCPRGKLDLTTTLKRNLLRRGEVHVVVDSLSHNVLHNRLLKTTIGRVLRCHNIDGEIHARLQGVYRYLSEIAEVELSRAAFSRVRLHRNNSHYRLPLAVCRLIHDARLIDESGGESHFRDFLRDERAMARVFEKFLYRFYSREQHMFRVRRRKIPWRDVQANEHDLRYLPQMRTDVTLESRSRKIVLDAKYYRQTLQSHFGRESIKSANLYQLLTYLHNVNRVGEEQVEGMLVYPTTTQDLSLRYEMQGFGLQVATVNLNQPWPAIHQRLLDLLQ